MPDTTVHITSHLITFVALTAKYATSATPNPHLAFFGKETAPAFFLLTRTRVTTVAKSIFFLLEVHKLRNVLCFC